MKIKVSVDKAKSVVTKVEVVSYAGETAGFGKDLIEGTSANEKQKSFYDTYLNASFNKSDVEGIDTSTGATITTKGIVEAIQKAIAAANQEVNNMNKILKLTLFLAIVAGLSGGALSFVYQMTDPIIQEQKIG